jgi:four helix bundle protein
MTAFQHHKLLVYVKALEVCSRVYSLTSDLRPQFWTIGRQLQRAVTSVLLNIAEGAGEFSPDDKARFYRMARRSAAEAAAALDLLCTMKVITAGTHAELQSGLNEIAAMLTAMVKTARRPVEVARSGGPCKASSTKRAAARQTRARARPRARPED